MENRTSKLKIDGVLEDKPPAVQLLALFLASNWMILDEILHPAKEGNAIEYLSAPSFEELEFYTTRFLDFLLHAISRLENIPDFPTDLIHTIKHIKDVDTGCIPDHCHPLPNTTLLEAIEKQSEEYRDFISPPKCYEKQRQTIKEKVLTPEFSFLCRIFMPCLFFYHTVPQTLFSQATQGDLDSIKKLLRLDKSLVHQTGISKIIATYWYKDKGVHYELMDALKNPIPNKYNKQYLKYRLSGLLAFISETFLQYRWTEKTLRELFNAISIDHGFSDLIDEDLPASPDAYRKAISHHKKEWTNIFEEHLQDILPKETTPEQ